MSLKRERIKKTTVKVDFQTSTIILDTEMTVSEIMKIMEEKGEESVKLGFATVYYTEFITEDLEEEERIIEDTNTNETEILKEKEVTKEEVTETEEPDEDILPF